MGAVTDDDGTILLYEGAGRAHVVGSDGSSLWVASGYFMGASFDGHHFHLHGRDVTTKVCSEELEPTVEAVGAGRVLLSFADDGRIWGWSLSDSTYQRFWSKAHLMASEKLPWLRRVPESSR